MPGSASTEVRLFSESSVRSTVATVRRPGRVGAELRENSEQESRSGGAAGDADLTLPEPVVERAAADERLVGGLQLVERLVALLGVAPGGRSGQYRIPSGKGRVSDITTRTRWSILRAERYEPGRRISAVIFGCERSLTSTVVIWVTSLAQ